MEICAENSGFPNGYIYTRECCLNSGNYALKCGDTYGDGWTNNGRYTADIQVGGKYYCKEFQQGYEMKEEILITENDASEPRDRTLNPFYYQLLFFNFNVSI